MAQKRKARLQDRRSLVEGLVRRILVRVVSGDLDTEEGCTQVRQIYLDESQLMAELKPLSEMVGNKSTEELRAAAAEWLRLHT